MKAWEYFLIATVAGVFSWQINELLRELRGVSDKYAAASAYAESVNKPLLKVGGAHGSDSENVVAADIRDMPYYPDKTFGAAFCSHILEHLPTINDAMVAINELNRVAERVYIVSFPKNNLFARLIADQHIWITEFPNGDILLEQRY